MHVTLTGLKQGEVLLRINNNICRLCFTPDIKITRYLMSFVVEIRGRRCARASFNRRLFVRLHISKDRDN